APARPNSRGRRAADTRTRRPQLGEPRDEPSAQRAHWWKSRNQMTNPRPRPRRRVNLIAGTIGHFVEWYDWYIYGLLAAVFSPQIFPSDSPFASLIAALLTYAIGFVIRPLSGVIVSPLADRFGRRKVLTLSISGMAVGSLIIGLTPSYDTIGHAAPALFVVARILQGISAGSGHQSAIAF